MPNSFCVCGIDGMHCKSENLSNNEIPYALRQKCRYKSIHIIYKYILRCELQYKFNHRNSRNVENTNIMLSDMT